MFTKMRERFPRVCLTTRLPFELHEAVEALAAELETSINQLICEALTRRFGSHFRPPWDPRTSRSTSSGPGRVEPGQLG